MEVEGYEMLPRYMEILYMIYIYIIIIGIYNIYVYFLCIIYVYIYICMYLHLCCLACKVGAMIWSHPPGFRFDQHIFVWWLGEVGDWFSSYPLIFLLVLGCTSFTFHDVFCLYENRLYTPNWWQQSLWILRNLTGEKRFLSPEIAST